MKSPILRYSLGFSALTVLLLALASSSHAQLIEQHPGLSSPLQGVEYQAGTGGACPISFTSSSDHKVVFIGPINATVSWSGSIAAYKGSSFVHWSAATEATDVPTDAGSGLVNVGSNVRATHQFACNATAIYTAPHGSSSYTGKGKSTAYGTFPGYAAHSPVTGEVTFYVLPAP